MTTRSKSTSARQIWPAHGVRIPTWATFAAAFTLAAASAALGDVAVEFREEARPELGAVRRWADISATNEVDELNDIRFALGTFEIGEGGGWCMPIVWPPEFHRRAEFVLDKAYEGGWGNDPEIAFRRDDAGNLTLTFKGAIRHKNRQESGRKSAPVAYETTVTLSADGACEYSTAFTPGEAVLKRGISFRIETDGPDGPKSETFRESGVWKTDL